MNQVQQIQADMEEMQRFIKMGQAFDRLRANPDFQSIVEDLYFRNEAIRLVQAKANPVSQNPQAQAAILRDMDGIGSFQQFLTNLSRGAAQAQDRLVQMQEELLVAESEEDEGEE